MPDSILVDATPFVGRSRSLPMLRSTAGQWFTDTRLGFLTSMTLFVSLILISPIGASVAIAGGFVVQGLSLLFDEEQLD